MYRKSMSLNFVYFAPLVVKFFESECYFCVLGVFCGQSMLANN